MAAGVLFHLWRRGGWRRFWGDLLAGALGFLAGQLTGDWLGTAHLLIGQTQVVPGLIGAVLLLFGARRLVRSQRKR